MPKTTWRKPTWFVRLRDFVYFVTYEDLHYGLDWVIWMTTVLKSVSSPFIHQGNSCRATICKVSQRPEVLARNRYVLSLSKGHFRSIGAQKGLYSNTLILFLTKISLTRKAETMCPSCSDLTLKKENYLAERRGAEVFFLPRSAVPGWLENSIKGE